MGSFAVTLTLFGVFYVFPIQTDARKEALKVDLIVRSKDISVGSTEVLFCKASKSTTFRWEKDGEEIEDNIETDEEKSRLTLKNVKLSDSGKYKCICDFDGDDVDDSVSIYVYETPSFGSTKTYHEFLVNQTVRIPCLVTGKPEVETNWYWNGLRVSNNDTSNLSVQPDGSLEITNIQREHHGIFICEGKIKGRPKTETLNISVVVNVPPTVIVRGEKTKVVAGPKKNVTLFCLVEGAPHPNITWETPQASDSSRYIYNSDRSKLIIPGVVRSDFGKYVCTAANKIGEDSATFMLDVIEFPLISLSQSEMVVNPGHSASVSCAATGHPTPTVQWMTKSKKSVMMPAMGSQLLFRNVLPSDGGVYSCIATNEAGKNSADFTLITSPEVPTSFAVSPGPSSFKITLQESVMDGGSPIVRYIIQWREKSTNAWENTSIAFSDQLEVKSLASYTEYFVRFAAQNKHLRGKFSDEKKIRTLDKREPDMPELTIPEGKIERNSYSIPVKQSSDGGSPISYYVVRWRMKKDGEPWREKKIDVNTTTVNLQNLEYDSEYQAEIRAVNANGFSKPAETHFSIPQAQPSLGKAGVVAIVLVVFVLLLVGVDALCCYTNRCGIINFLARKMFGPNVSESKSLEEGVFNNAVTMNGLEKQKGSTPKLQSLPKTINGGQPEVTCDKAPLTKFEKTPAGSNSVNEARL